MAAGPGDDYGAGNKMPVRHTVRGPGHATLQPIPPMILNLLFTALCLGLTYIVTLDIHASRRAQPVRVRARRPNSR